MDAIVSHHRPSAGRLRGLTAMLAAGCLVAGCTAAAASPSPTGTTPPAPAPSAADQPTTGPTANPTSTALPSVGAAPAGKWSGIRWIAAGPVFPQTPVPDGGEGSSVGINVFGWSRGYVGFRIADSPTFSETDPTAGNWAMVSTSSADGLHWTPGKALDSGGMTSWIFVGGVVEGPAGLLAVGRNPAAMCGGPPTVGALWTSPDGQTWTRVQLPADFASARVYTVDAGSAGYIATGTLKDELTPAVWVSADGRSWRRTALPKPTSGVVVDGATAFAGGYVISGAHPLDAGCGESEYVPSLWWSADGNSWTPGKPPGAMPSDSVSVTVNRISDRALIAIAQEWDAAGSVGSQQVWVSGDGRTWNPIKSPSSLLSDRILTNGQRGLVVVPAASGGPPTIATVDDDLTVTTLGQSGEGPDSSTGWTSALGPTGVLIVSVDGLNLWLGVPEA